MFPQIVYGRCEWMGHRGSEYPSGHSNLHANSDSADGTTGNGYELVEFEGKWVCKPCKRRVESERESIQSASKHAEEDKFRAAAGFTRL